MVQANLFGFKDPAPAQRHSRTSMEAAVKIDAKTLRAKVLTTLTMMGARGATDEELQEVLEMNPSTERPRRIELVNAGSVRDSGKTRKTRSGRSAVVWVAV